MVKSTEKIAVTTPLPMRMRLDLVAHSVQHGDHHYWNIKDPLSLRYFQLRDEEYFLLRHLDGATTAAALTQRFEQTFAPWKLGMEELHAYLSQLSGLGLILIDDPQEAGRVLQRHQRIRQRKRRSYFTNPLVLRMRGFDPDSFLRWAYPRCRWLFSRWCLALAMAVALSAMTLLFVQREILIARLPTMATFFHPGNWFWMLLALAIAKALHEIGHALCCQHFGRECREIGVMLLAFMPCLYCDVSDAWTLPNKWHRAAIGGAGILVEILLASVCVFVWWNSEPGILNTIALNLIVVCSVNSVLLNGNPLLRYDGYYVLSDLVEVPNLRQRSCSVLKHYFEVRLLGIHGSNQRGLPVRGRPWLMLYAIASRIYSLVVLGGILWVLNGFLHSYGLGVIAQIAIALILGGILIQGTRQLVAYAGNTWRRQLVSRWRLGVLGSLAVGLIASLMLIPLPHHVTGTTLIEPSAAQRVFVGMTGRVPSANGSPSPRLAGTAVVKGDVLVELENLQNSDEVLAIHGECAVLESRIKSMEQMRVKHPETAAALSVSRENLVSLQQRLSDRQRQESRLTLRAPCTGVILPGSGIFPPTSEQELPQWDGTPLDPKNCGCTLELGTLYCLVGNPEQSSAVLLVEQSDLPFVKIGASVELWLKQVPAENLLGRVIQIADAPLEELSPDLAGLELSLVRDDNDSTRPTHPMFQVRVALKPALTAIPLYSTGWGKIEAAPQSCIERVYRWLATTFRFSGTGGR